MTNPDNESQNPNLYQAVSALEANTTRLIQAQQRLEKRLDRLLYAATTTAAAVIPLLAMEVIRRI